MEQRKENVMGTKPIRTLLPGMAFPIMLSMLVQALYNVVDSIFVAMLSENALASVNLVFPVQNLMIAVAVGTATGINAILSRRLGEKNYAAAEKVAANGVLITLVTWLAFAAFGAVGSAWFLDMFTKVPEIAAGGTVYMRIVTVLGLGSFMQITFERILQSTGKTVYQMISQMTGAVVNIILDPIMIFGLLGLPAMGVAGAAIATVAGQMLACGLAVLLFIKKEKQIHISFKGFQFDKAVAVKIYSIGIPSCIMLSLPSLLVGILNALLTSFSSLAVAVFGLYYKFQSFVYMPENGIIQGMRPIMSYNYGAGYLKRMKETVTCSMISCGAILAAGTVLFLAVPGPIMGMFGAEGEMLEMGISCLRLISLGFIFSAAGTVFCGCFEALGQGL